MLLNGNKLSTLNGQHQINLNRSVIGKRSFILNKSQHEISCINNKSECVSDNDISQYIFKNKNTMQNKLNTEVNFLDNREYRGIIASTFDNYADKSKFERETSQRSWSRTPKQNKDESFSYKALMELKGSKCTCVHSIYMKERILD
jgi:hypothetical protein